MQVEVSRLHWFDSCLVLKLSGVSAALGHLHSTEPVSALASVSVIASGSSSTRKVQRL